MLLSTEGRGRSHYGLRGRSRVAAWIFATGVCVSTAYAPSSAFAGDPPSKPTKQQQAAATAKFKEGERAFKSHDYSKAAVAFEEAYAIAPHPDVLLNAIDSREKAGDLAIAATWCAHLMREYPGSKGSNEASQRLARLRPKLGRIDVAAEGGTLEGLTIDGREAEAGESYVDPGDHIVRGNVNGKPVEKRINVVAGARANVLLELEPEVKEPTTPPPPPPPKDDEKPLHPAIFFVGLGLTVVSGAVLIWSGIDTNAALNDFEQNPTQTGFDDGLAKETRTNVLIGVTSVLGIATAAIGIFATEWGGGSDAPTATAPAARVRLRIGPMGGVVEGAF